MATATVTARRARTLSIRETAFVAHYAALSCNGAPAAIKAGYSPKAAKGDGQPPAKPG